MRPKLRALAGGSTSSFVLGFRIFSGVMPGSSTALWMEPKLMEKNIGTGFFALDGRYSSRWMAGAGVSGAVWAEVAPEIRVKMKSTNGKVGRYMFLLYKTAGRPDLGHTHGNTSFKAR